MTEINRLVDSVYLPPVIEAPVVETVAVIAPVSEPSIEAPVGTLTEPVLEPAPEIAAPEAALEAPLGMEVPTEAPVVEVVAVVDTLETTPPAPVEEEETSFDKLFALRPDVSVAARGEDESDEDSDDKKDKKKSKKKGVKKFVEITYDPDADVTVARKKHKLGDDGIDWE
jgi:hypothetical protein